MEEFAERRRITLPQLAVAWLLSYEKVCGVITGVTRMEHLENNAQATNIELMEEDLERIPRPSGVLALPEQMGNRLED